MAETSATAQLSQVINASLNATATSSVEALIGLVLISTTTANGSISTANLFINRLLTSSVTAQGTTNAEALIAKLLQSSVTAQANTTSNTIVSKLASSSVNAQANITANSLVSKLLASTVNGVGNVTANLQLADLLSLTVNGTATIEALLEAASTLIGDPYIDNVSLLLQGDDNPTGVTQNNTFKDSSTNNFTITRNGNVTQGTFSPFDKSITNSGGSGYFDGTGDNLTLPDNDAWHFGSGNFTVESWVYITSSNVQQIIVGQWDGVGGGTGLSWVIVTSNDANRYLRFLISSNGSTVVFDLVSTSSIPLNQWSHVAIVRNGNVFQLYLNGIAATGGSTTNSASLFNTTNVLTVGSSSTNTQYFFGYISNLRVVKGTAVYTTNFQPSTIPLTAITNTSLLLNFNNAAIFDGVKLNNVETVGNASINTSIFKYGTGSLSFDGTSYLNVGNQSALELLSNDFTVEFWLYKNTTAAYMTVCGDLFVASTNTWQIIFDVNGTKIAWYNGANNTFTLTSTNIVSNTTWTHIAFVRLGTTLTVYLNGVPNGSATLSTNYSSTTNLFIGHTPELLAGRYLNGYLDDFRITKGVARYTSNFTVPTKLSSLIPNYLINRSLRFSSSRSTYLSRTPTVASNRKTWTWSGWVKRGIINITNQYASLFIAGTSTGTASSLFYFGFWDTNGIRFSSGTAQLGITNAVFRDLSAWYHIVVSVDTTQAIIDNRIKVYVNGIQQTMTVTSLAQHDDTAVNSNIAHYIGQVISSQYFDGYMAEVNFIDGQALTPTSFGELNLNLGTWIPKLYTGTYGTNGFRLKFSDLTQLGEDFSGNLNNWTPSGFSVIPGTNYDLMTDSPTNTSDTIGNYATLNPLNINSAATYSNGNLDVNTGVAAGGPAFGSISVPTTGKWYWEVTPLTNVTTSFCRIGVVNTSRTIGVEYYNNGNRTLNGSADTTYGATYTNNDVIGVLCDVTNNTVSFYKNNLVQPTIPFSGWSSDVFAMIADGNGSAGLTATFNFGQRPFVYTPPTGFKALNTFNLPTPTIGATAATQANKFMDVSLYTGTGVAQSIFNSGGFKPDLVWIKNRTGTAANHAIYDINRGVTKQLSSSSDALEVTNVSGLTSFDNTGFSIGTLADINTNGNNYIAWQWRADGTPLTLIAGNTISSSVSVNSVSKFSIITYTGNGTAGATIAHGLGVVPRMVMIKSINGAVSNWAVYHGSLGNTSSLFLNTNGVSLASNTYWNNTNPTTNLISLGTSDLVNANARNYVAYAWAEIDGFSKFNSYVGSGSLDGTFVYTGFRPKFILIKSSSAATTNWAMYNSIVNTSNPVINELLANSSAIENTTGTDLDFLSNGFKLRSTNADINTSAATYIYAAFGEFPLKYANAALTERVMETVEVDYLVIAGGGGGGAVVGGGGGAGGYRTNANYGVIKNNAYTVTVGGAGVGGSSTGGTGGNSVFDLITSAGGGGGATNPNAGVNGGSGGGGADQNLAAGVGNLGGNGNTPSVSPSQGNNGGRAYNGIFPSGGSGGGGGAGTAGSDAAPASIGGNGGTGSTSTITGSSVIRAAGGGGWGGTTAGTGGSSIGGNAASGGGTANGGNGTVYTGSGGGGGANTPSNGGQGGKGVVIVRWLTSSATITLAGGAENDAQSFTDGSFSIREIRNSGTITFS
jgi:hypothetical protein